MIEKSLKFLPFLLKCPLKYKEFNFQIVDSKHSARDRLSTPKPPETNWKKCRIFCNNSPWDGKKITKLYFYIRKK